MMVFNDSAMSGMDPTRVRMVSSGVPGACWVSVAIALRTAASAMRGEGVREGMQKGVEL